MQTTIDADEFARPSGLLPDWMIRKYIPITPFAEGMKRPGIISYGLSSVGYDARLGEKFKLFTNIHTTVIDPKALDERSFIDITASHCIIPPNSYVLAETVEHFEIPRDIACIAVGKSTYARAGIIVNLTPGEPCWKGKLTLEIANASPIPAKIYANEGICQIMFFRTLSDCETSYEDKNGKYQHQKGLVLPMVD